MLTTLPRITLRTHSCSRQKKKKFYRKMNEWWLNFKKNWHEWEGKRAIWRKQKNNQYCYSQWLSSSKSFDRLFTSILLNFSPSSLLSEKFCPYRWHLYALIKWYSGRPLRLLGSSASTDSSWNFTVLYIRSLRLASDTRKVEKKKRKYIRRSGSSSNNNNNKCPSCLSAELYLDCGRHFHHIH